jgi:hypothetical protein
MSCRLEKLFGASVASSDGEIGRIKDVYFDDQCWADRARIPLGPAVLAPPRNKPVQPLPAAGLLAMRDDLRALP